MAAREETKNDWKMHGERQQKWQKDIKKEDENGMRNAWEFHWIGKSLQLPHEWRFVRKPFYSEPEQWKTRSRAFAHAELPLTETKDDDDGNVKRWIKYSEIIDGWPTAQL